MSAAPGVDFMALAAAMDETREALRAMVAGLVDDGFTDREAHAIVARIMSTPTEGEADA